MTIVRQSAEHGKRDELRQWCQSHFREKEVPALPPTGNILLDKTITVKPIDNSPVHGVQSDGMDYVGLTLTFDDMDDQTFKGGLPLVLARFKDGKYRGITDTSEMKSFDSLPEVQRFLKDFIDGMTADRIAALLAKERARHRVK